MRVNYPVPLLVVVGLLGVGAARGAEPGVRLVATASKTTVTVGEQFTVQLQGEAPGGTSWSFPAEVKTPEVALKLVERAASGSDAVYQAVVFGLDQAVIPPITVAYQLPNGEQGEAASDPVTLSVASLLGDDPASQALAPLRPPVPLPAGTPFWIALGLAVGVVAGIAVWAWRRRRRAGSGAAQKVVPQLPPADEALAALSQLEQAGLIERGDLRTFYIELVATAKRYLKRRLAAPVLEMTSTETWTFLRDHPLMRNSAGAVKELTFTADCVKFARGEGDETRAHRHLAQVRALVEEVEGAVASPAASPGEGPAA